MRFDPFVIPFCLGFGYLIIVLLVKYGGWISELGEGSGKKILRALFTGKTIRALKEVFLESLVHQKIFRVNPLLGYMHMSLAFGWFLLIVVGKFEAFSFTGDFANEFYYPIFFRFFEPLPHRSTTLLIFNFFMDFLLLLILSGVALALLKRFRSGLMGMKSSTRHTMGDKWALALLWMIFPLRLLAESTTAGVTGNGSFLTQPFGNWIAAVLPAKMLAYPLWWTYSAVLGGFLVALPYSRYMHIPTEIFLIFLRNWGIKSEDALSGFASFELYSCSRCGICIDPCQMNPSVSRQNQMVYFLRDLRAGKTDAEMAHNCLLCGRCQETCPVGIDLTQLRLLSRKQKNDLPVSPALPHIYPTYPPKSTPPDVIYFSGCMGGLTPGIQKSMEFIFRTAGIHYFFLDKEKACCCGRPAKLAGRMEEAASQSEALMKAIQATGATTLVTSCPVCYKNFKDSYNCQLRILHHSEYLIELTQNGLIRLLPDFAKQIVYHDPCELGRKSGIYMQPRELLNQLGTLIPQEAAFSRSLCCGGSPGNLTLPMAEREALQQSTALYLNQPNPDWVATACPLCKKSLTKFSHAKVIDLAELVAENLIIGNTRSAVAKKQNLAVLTEAGV